MPAAALVVAAVAAVASTAVSVVSGNKARAQQRHAQDLQEQSANEQRAQNAQDKAAAARQQYREERVRRARIMQQSEAGGTEGSSGELGALSGLATNYSVASGGLQGRYDRGVTIGNLQSEANKSIFGAQQTLSQGQSLSSIFSTVGSIAGSFASYGTKAPTGTTSQPGQAGYNANNGFDNPSNYG
jgi:hypothetical protein